MNLEDVYQFYGNITQAAEAVNVSRQTFHKWMRKGIIPFNQQQRYQKLSSGKLVASSYPDATKNQDYIPSFRFWSDTLGMCKVHSLTYLSDRAPRIRYYDPVNMQLKFASFDVYNLMQSTVYSDKQNKVIFEGDILLFDEREYHFIGLQDWQMMRMIVNAHQQCLIIGNKFERKNNGHKRDK